MANENFPLRTVNDPPKDPQQRYDEDLSEYTSGDRVEQNDDRLDHTSGRFPKDFYQYSQDFHDREDGAPGTDQDFGTAVEGREFIEPARAPQDDMGESQSDRRIREEIMSLLAQNEDIGADDVSAQVEDGVVILSGNVDRARAKAAIEERVQLVPGVDEVLNCLIVNPPSDLH
jgi:hypothetical protein